MDRSLKITPRNLVFSLMGLVGGLLILLVLLLVFRGADLDSHPTDKAVVVEAFAGQQGNSSPLHAENIDTIAKFVRLNRVGPATADLRHVRFPF